jgi:hypothetical protein
MDGREVKNEEIKKNVNKSYLNSKPFFKPKGYLNSGYYSNKNYVGHDKLNSTRVHYKSKNNFSERHKEYDEIKKTLEEIKNKKNSFQEKISFEIPIKGAKGAITHLERLHDLRNQDVLQWCIDFERITKLLEYEEKNSLDLFQIIISDEIRKKIKDNENIKAALKALKKLAYNKEKVSEMLEIIRKHKLTKKIGIREYGENFKKLVKKFNACVNENEKLNKREKNEYFENGLPNWMKEEICRHPNSKRSEIIDTVCNKKNRSGLIKEI